MKFSFEYEERYNRTRRTLILVIVSALMIFAVGGIILFSVLVGREERVQEGVQQSAAAENTNEILVSDRYLGQNRIPRYEIPLNTYTPESFLKGADGMIRYEDAAIGVDVSDYQHEIDWARAKAAGVSFAILRAGYRGFTEGSLVEDGYLKTNLAGASAQGIDLGLYFFSQATSEEEAREEARYVVELAGDYELVYPIVYDWEQITVHSDEVTPRTDSCSPEEITAFTKAFCEEIKALGHKPAYYTNKTMGYNTYHLEDLQEYDLWYAEYQDIPSFYYNFDIWQYTEAGVVDGIPGHVDLNVSLKKY